MVFSMLNLKAAIKAANLNQDKWAKEQGISDVTASRMVTRGCIVVGGQVYSPINIFYIDKTDKQTQ